jgi:hypothetical protein
MWERREGDKDMKRIKHKKKLVLDYLTMKVKSLQSFQTWELQTQSHSITSQKTWIVNDPMTLNFTYYRCHHHHHNHQYLCCCFHQWSLLFLYFSSIRPKLEYSPTKPKSMNVPSRNLYFCAVTVAYHEDFSYDDPLHTLQVRRNNLHCTL